MSSGSLEMPLPIADESQRRLALIVATSDYRDPTLHRLRAPGTDAKALAKVLGDPEIGAFDVQILLNLPSHELSRGIAQFCADSRPTDLLLLYISCHGVLDDRGRLYYATVNTERRLLGASSVSAQWLNDQLEDCSARRQLLFLDCCHSGAFERGMKGDLNLALQDRFGSRGRVVLTASRATEYSFEGEQVRGQGISSFFTTAMVEGLRTGDADRDQDGAVTVRELYDHVFDRMRARNARQTPAMWADAAEGDILVAHSPRGPVITPVALPEYLRAALGSPAPGIRESAVSELAALLDRAEPGLTLTARETLEEVAKNDVRMVALLARTALDAEPGRAAEQVRRELGERVRRLAEDRARRQKEEEEDRARRQKEQEDRARRQKEEQARRKEEQAARRLRTEQRRRDTHQLLRSLSRRWVVVLAVSVVIGGALLLLIYVLRTQPTEETIMGELPADLRASCSATTDTSANCLIDGTPVFFRLFDTAAEARTDVVKGNEPSGTPCPPSAAPAAGKSVVCGYTVGAETGTAAFSHTVKDTQRFYEVRWNPEAQPRLRGQISTENITPQDWKSLLSTWTRLAGMH